jgi:hypothetical protein
MHGYVRLREPTVGSSLGIFAETRNNVRLLGQFPVVTGAVSAVTTVEAIQEAR